MGPRAPRSGRSSVTSCCGSVTSFWDEPLKIGSLSRYSCWLDRSNILVYLICWLVDRSDRSSFWTTTLFAKTKRAFCQQSTRCFDSEVRSERIRTHNNEVSGAGAMLKKQWHMLHNTWSTKSMAKTWKTISNNPTHTWSEQFITQMSTLRTAFPLDMGLCEVSYNLMHDSWCVL